MKYFLVFAVILLLGCNMPGVGELEERVDDLETTVAYDDSDLMEMIEEFGSDLETLDERLTAIEYGDEPGVRHARTSHETPAGEAQVQKLIAISDIRGLQDSMDVLYLSLDSLTLENDSLRADLEDLQDKVASLSYTVENMRYTGTESGATRGGSGTSGSGRGSSTSSGGIR
ncbi:MAG: hypothetical protein GQ565_03295 [Candidatus Aegiribacteria sp.]|nr:hypothetical protein [Candidatus Aegiribacteria sp.]